MALHQLLIEELATKKTLRKRSATVGAPSVILFVLCGCMRFDCRSSITVIFFPDPQDSANHNLCMFMDLGLQEQEGAKIYFHCGRYFYYNLLFGGGKHLQWYQSCLCISVMDKSPRKPVEKYYLYTLPSCSTSKLCGHCDWRWTFFVQYGCRPNTEVSTQCSCNLH